MELAYELDAPAAAAPSAPSIDAFARRGRRISFRGDAKESEAAVEQSIANGAPLRAIVPYFHSTEEAYQYYADRMATRPRAVEAQTCAFCKRRPATQRVTLMWRGRFDAGPGTAWSKTGLMAARKMGFVSVTADHETIEFGSEHPSCKWCRLTLAPRRLIYSVGRAGGLLALLLGPLAVLVALYMTSAQGSSSTMSQADQASTKALLPIVWLIALLLFAAIWALPALAKWIIGPVEVRSIARDPFEWVGTRGRR